MSDDPAGSQNVPRSPARPLPGVGAAGRQALLAGATAVLNGRNVHAVDCPHVRQWVVDGGWWPGNWQVIYSSPIAGKPMLCCSPAATVQGRRQRVPYRLTGVGWPMPNGTCFKGRLPDRARGGWA